MSQLFSWFRKRSGSEVASSSPAHLATSPKQTSMEAYEVFLAPWDDVPEKWRGRENELKNHILQLSENPISFKIDVPPEFTFDYGEHKILQMATAAMKEDENLASVKFSLVPTCMDQNQFWRAYFYNVYLIRETDDIKNLHETLEDLWTHSKKYLQEKQLKEELDKEFAVIDEKVNVCIDWVGRYIAGIIKERTLGVKVVPDDLSLIQAPPSPLEQEQQKQATTKSAEASDSEATPEPPKEESAKPQEAEASKPSETAETASVSETNPVPAEATAEASKSAETTEEKPAESKPEETLVAPQTSVSESAPAPATTEPAEEKPAESQAQSSTEAVKVLSEDDENFIPTISQIDLLMRECVERKKKLAFLASEADESFVKKLQAIHDLFQTLMVEYGKFQRLTFKPKRVIKVRTFEPQLLGVTRDPASMCTIAQMQDISYACPFRLQRTNLKLLYCTLDDGFSLHTFFSRTEQQGPTVTLIRTTKGTVFGVFTAVSWEPNSRYYGTGETFVFTFKTGSFAAYKWTKKNKFFLMSDKTIMVGGGSDGRPAIRIDEEMLNGSSYPCQTFNSESLDHEVDFEIFSIEVWGFVEVPTKKESSGRKRMIPQHILAAQREAQNGSLEGEHYGSEEEDEDDEDEY